MHRRIKFVFIFALSLFTLFGCRDKGYREVESSLTDLQILELAALKFAMKSHADSGREKEEYQFYVIDRREFLEDFEGFKPTVALVDGERFGRNDGVFQELATGKNAKLWEIGETKITQDSASVWITWHSASLAGEGLSVKLEKDNGKWIAKSIVDGPIS